MPPTLTSSRLRPAEAAPPHHALPTHNEVWSLRDIVDKMLKTPRSQFNIYYSDQVPTSRQRELVSYKTGFKRGCVKRSLQGWGGSMAVPFTQLYNWISQDVSNYSKYHFTFVTSPVYGEAADSENYDVRNDHQVIYPTPIASNLVA